MNDHDEIKILRYISQRYIKLFDPPNNKKIQDMIYLFIS